MANAIEFRERINPGTGYINLRSEVNGQADKLSADQRRNLGLAFERSAARAVGSGSKDTDRLQGFDIFNVGINEYVLFYQKKYHKAASEEVDRRRSTVETIGEGEELAGRMRIERGRNGLEAVLYDAAILDEAIA